jgi:2-dehydro-3-deoxy-D-gluconate 5-dehydrogenase
MNVLNLFSLTGKTALVTGCNKGLGRSMALALAEAGADIIGVSSSLESSGSEIEQLVQTTGRSFKAYQCDFSDRAAIKNFILKLTSEFPIIDILVNNAGLIRRSPVAEHSDEDWDLVIAVNLDAPFILTREIGKKMLDRGNGKIIFTASLLSFQGGVLVPGYAASKGAISSLIKAFSNEWAGKGIQVNGIAPGYFATDNTEALRNDPERSKAILSRIPANRWGEPDDLKGVTVFLASAASDYVNGTLVTVDGGWMGR